MKTRKRESRKRHHCNRQGANQSTQNAPPGLEDKGTTREKLSPKIKEAVPRFPPNIDRAKWEDRKTYIFVSGRVSDQILNDMLGSTCSHPATPPWASHRKLWSPALPRVQSVLFSFSLTSTRYSITIAEHRKCVGRDDGGRSEGVRHVFNGDLPRRPFTEQQLRSVQRGLR